MNPELQKFGTGRKEHLPVIGEDVVEVHRVEFDDMLVNRQIRRAPPFIPEVLMGETEASCGVIVLTRHYPVKPDCSPFQILLSKFDQLETVPFASVVRVDDVEAHESVIITIPRPRNMTDDFPVADAYEITARVRRVEGIGITQPGIPSFSSRYLKRIIHLLARHSPDCIVSLGHWVYW